MFEKRFKVCAWLEVELIFDLFIVKYTELGGVYLARVEHPDEVEGELTALLIRGFRGILNVFSED